VRIVWLRAALFDIQAIQTYTETESPPAARKIEQRIKTAVGLLAEHPYIDRPGRVSVRANWWCREPLISFLTPFPPLT
jgi:plasmid stabilization system protein ParE